jgi:hypothetical protein
LEGVSKRLCIRLRGGGFGKVVKTERLVFRRGDVKKIIEQNARGIDGRRKPSRDIVREEIVSKGSTILIEKCSSRLTWRDENASRSRENHIA